MFSPLRNRFGRRLNEPFGKAGLTVAVIALVFAMLGGAYAAGGLTAKQKKEVKAIAKSFQGTGPAGPQGQAGANGNAGAKGDTGGQGPEGKEGPQGKEGKEGKAGKNGKDGSFGTEPLAAGQTLSGIWGMEDPAGANKELAVLSFPIRVSPAPTLAIFAPSLGAPLFVTPAGGLEEPSEEEFEEQCPGTAASPAAKPGFLCVYPAEETGLHIEAFGLIKPEGLPTEYGARLPFEAENTATTEVAYGAWAVTG